MNAINLKSTETNSTPASILQFPIKPTATEIKHDAKEIKIVPWVNDNNAMYRRFISSRNAKAKQYINACKQKRAFKWKALLMDVLGGFSLLFMTTGIFALYFILC
jgi:hypothetical protein